MHQTHLDKCVGTESKVPAVNVNVYSLSLMRSAYGTKSKLVTRDVSMSLTESIQRLNFYTKNIVCGEGLSDLIYFVSPISLYAYRMERSTLTEI